MEASYKRSLKAKARLLNKLAWLFLAFGFLVLIGTIIARSYIDGQWSGLTAVLLLCATLAPMFIGALIGMSSGMCTGELRAYMAKIKEYRVRKAFQKCMDYILAGDLPSAMDIYSDYIPVKHPTRDYLYSILILLMSKSDDPELQKRGTEKIQGMREYYDPSRVKL